MSNVELSKVEYFMNGKFTVVFCVNKAVKLLKQAKQKKCMKKMTDYILAHNESQLFCTVFRPFQFMILFIYFFRVMW